MQPVLNATRTRIAGLQQQVQQFEDAMIGTKRRIADRFVACAAY